MDDRQIADTVNTLRDIAIKFHDTQQLRERIAHVFVPIIYEYERRLDVMRVLKDQLQYMVDTLNQQ